jgi:hypothetical protein
MKFHLLNLLIVIYASLVSIDAKPIERSSMQENVRSGLLSKEKRMRNKNPVDVFCDYLSVMSYDYLIKKRVHYFTLISRKITNVEKYLGFDSVTTSKADLSINQTHGDVEARREKLTMDLLLELYPTSGPFVQLLYSSHEQLKNQTYIDKLKPALSNLKIKVDRLKAFNEEEIQIQTNITSNVITNINISTVTEEIRKMKVKKNENGANETDHAGFGSTATLQQIFPVFADDSQLPVTNTPDTNGITKKIHDNSARNDSKTYGTIIAVVFGGLLVISVIGFLVYIWWDKRKNPPSCRIVLFIHKKLLKVSHTLSIST